MRLFIYFILILVLCSGVNVFAQEETSLYDDAGKRDPFIPLVDENGRFVLEVGELFSFTDLSLSGILWDPNGNSTALINDEIVQSGQSFYGFTIGSITENSVTVSRDGQEYILWSSEEGGQ